MEVLNLNLYYRSLTECVAFLDNVPEDETFDRIALPLFVTYTILSVLGMIFACICLCFNLWFRNQKYVY